ncbi:hypothetical protein GE061_004804 [Apolygus lucorum]|uniref:Reverse transcriptase zinc-binding domain-containing protein n=1 Tax=Apolygus lucorum TaxID=248454 RepID=A0A8S9X491_APOLU|nr:hypothetical protein GE061_004804 [Apolygus lucorum]
MPHGRYPGVVAREVVRSEISWFRALTGLARRHGCEFHGDLERLNEWPEQLDELVEVVCRSWSDDMKIRAQATRNPLYPLRNLEIRPANLLLDEESPLWIRRWILRLRGALLALNDGIYSRSDAPGRLCSLCNLNENEDVVHFFGTCPVLREFRLRYLGSIVLDREQMVYLLDNRQEWLAVGQFAFHAWRYREFLVKEFNWFKWRPKHTKDTTRAIY